MFKFSNILLIISILMVTLSTSGTVVHAESTSFFAQIQTENVFLFEDKGTKPIFEIPNTYYVKLLEDEVDGYYKAQYMNLTGFIRASEIQCVDEYPFTAYLENVNFRILASQSAELRSEPSRSLGLATLVCELPLYETNFVYYGKIQGEEVVPSRSNIWYYASYTKNGVTQFGYIYSGLTDNFTSYSTLPLSLYPITKHNWASLEEDPVITPSFEPPTSSELVIIIAITVPALLLLFFMLKTSKKARPAQAKNNGDIIKMPPPKTATSVPHKKKRGKDYYEID